MIKLIPNSKQGHGLMVFCNKCKKRQSISNHCNHQDKWRYKTDFKIDGKRYARVLLSDNFDDALQELFEFKKTIKHPKISSLCITKKNFTIIEGIEKYYQKVLCLNEFQINKPKSRDHQNECIRIVKRFGESLEHVGINLSTTDLNTLNTNVLNVFYSYIKMKYNVNSASSIDKHTRIMRHFFTFLGKIDMYSSSNYFKAIETSPIESTPMTITDREFDKVLSVINLENGHSKSRGGNRNQYKPWLKDALIIGRHTGLRRDEIYNLKWSDIIEHEGSRFFNIVDLKVTKQKGRIYSKVAPITDELYLNLDVMRMNSSSDSLIDSNLMQSTFKDTLSRSFTHFYSVAHPNKPVKHFKHLRKSHITELGSILGPDAYLASGHSSNRVLEKHYINRIAAVTKFAKFKNQLKAEQVN